MKLYRITFPMEGSLMSVLTPRHGRYARISMVWILVRWER